MNKQLIFGLLAAFLIAFGAEAKTPFAVSPAQGHQPVKVKVTNQNPDKFTISLKSFANLGVNKKAKTYVMYNTSSVPEKCGDFSKLDVNYKKPDKFTRIFDLSDKKEVIQAMNEYGCIIIPNKPKLPPAKS